MPDVVDGENGKYQIVIQTDSWRGFTTVSQIIGGEVIVYKPNNVDFYHLGWDQTDGTATLTVNNDGVDSVIPDNEINSGDHAMYIQIWGWPRPYYVRNVVIEIAFFGNISASVFFSGFLIAVLMHFNPANGVSIWR